MVKGETIVYITCPNNDCDTTLSEEDFRAALRHRKETDGLLLGSCKVCARVFLLPEEMPNAGKELDAWIAEASDDPEQCCPCVPFLDDAPLHKPAGRVGDLGTVFTYTAGDGGPAMKRWRYMKVHGIDPQIYYELNPSMGAKPFDTAKHPEPK
jgi:hypothetical protein